MSAVALSGRAEAGRKAIHLLTAALPIAWALGLVTQGQLRVALTMALGVALVVEWARRASPSVAAWFSARVGGLLRAHEVRAVTGATWLALAMSAVVWCVPARAAIAALWAAAVGDAAAALVGRASQRGRPDAGAAKSVAGSAAAAVSTAIGVLLLAQGTAVQALAIGLAVAAAERPRGPLDDNLRVAAAAALAGIALGLR